MGFPMKKQLPSERGIDALTSGLKNAFAMEDGKDGTDDNGQNYDHDESNDDSDDDSDDKGDDENDNARRGKLSDSSYDVIDDDDNEDGFGLSVGDEDDLLDDG